MMRYKCPSHLTNVDLDSALTFIMKEAPKDITKKKKRKQARVHAVHDCSLEVVSGLLQETVLYCLFSLHTRKFFFQSKSKIPKFN